MIKHAKQSGWIFSVLLMVISMTGCFSSNSDNRLYFNRQQSVVMEPAVLAAGIVAGRPAITRHENGTRATVTLSNTQSYPVAIRYRFYWYNEQGLEISPASRVNDITIKGDGDIEISADVPDKTISYVRIYLFT